MRGDLALNVIGELCKNMIGKISHFDKKTISQSRRNRYIKEDLYNSQKKKNIVFIIYFYQNAKESENIDVQRSGIVIIDR